MTEPRKPYDVTADIERHLARVSDPGYVRKTEAYEEDATADRAAVVKQFIDQGIIENATADERTFQIEVFPLLDEEGKFTHPFGVLVQNRFDLHSRFVLNQAHHERRLTREDLSAESRLTSHIMAHKSKRLAEIYFTDYAILHLVSNYVHGLWSPKREHLKKMAQVHIMNETDGTTELGVASRERRLKALDILAPEGGYDFSKMLSDEELIEIAEEIGKHQKHLIDKQVKESIYKLLSTELSQEEVESDLPFSTFRLHDDYTEFAKTVAIMVADDSGELEGLYYDSINKKMERMGMDPDEAWFTIHLLTHFAESIRLDIAESDS